MPMQPAILGTARLGNFRLGYVPPALAAIRLTRVGILLAGVEARARVRIEGLTVHDILNDTPNTCNLTIDGSPAPVGDEPLRITLGSAPPRVLFAGALQTVDLTYEGLPAQLAYPCTAIDDTPRANRLRPIGQWTAVSATTVAQALIATFAPQFSTAGIAAGLPNVTVAFDGSEGMSGCFAEIARLIGGGCFKFEDLTAYLFLTDTSDPPDAIDDTPGRFLDTPPIALTLDVAQLKTRVIGLGKGSSVLIAAPAGSPTIPVEDTRVFSSGQAQTGTQVLTYTGVSADAGTAAAPNGSTVAGIPQAPGSLSAAVAGVGGGLGNGTYGYKQTVVNVDGDESEAGSAATVTINTVTAPGAPSQSTPANTPGNLLVGTYKYKVAYKTKTGLTLPGSASGGATVAAVTAPGSAPTLTGQTGGALTGTNTYYYSTTYVDALGETNAGSSQSIALGGTGNTAVALTNIPTSGDGRVTKRRIYRGTSAASSSWFFLVELADNTTTTYTDRIADVALGGVVPTSNTTGTGQQSLTSIPTSGDARVTARVLYRTVAGGSIYYELATINDNATTTYTDNADDASLVQNDPAPSVLTDKTTPDNDQVSLFSIAAGPTGTVARKVYRTLAGGSVYKYAFTISDNTTTTHTDNSADTSLGLDLPTESEWRTRVGATTLPVQKLEKFSEGFGWVKVGNQILKFTGRSTTSGRGNLTGIPASGLGSISADLLFDNDVVAVPFLKGVPTSGAGSLAYTLTQGDQIAIRAVRNDLTAQTAAAARESTATYTSDGVHEFRVVDTSCDDVATLTARCDAELALWSQPIVTVTYDTRDMKTQSGKTVHIEVTTPPIGPYDLTIQDVTISEIDRAPGTAPRYHVTASSVRFTLEALLRQALAAGAG